MAALAAAFLAGCGASGDGTPNDAAGAKVLRNLLSKYGVGAKVVSFKKTQGREQKSKEINAYELWYEAEVAFPDGYQAACSDEKARGRCTFLALTQDQAFEKGEVLKSEGTLHFVKSDKGWVGEDQNAY